MTKRVLETSLWGLMVFATLIEHCVLIWYWTSGGAFYLLAVPIVYLSLLAVHIFLLCKLQRNRILFKMILSSLLVANPALIIVLVEIIANIMNVSTYMQ